MKEKISIFKSSFLNTSHFLFYDDELGKLTHPGEYGTYREQVTKEFVRFFIPRKLDVDDGFIINTNEQISTQSDIIIYDRNTTPLIQTSELQRFFPVETVVAVGEIKSKLSKSQFKTAINKLAKTKRLKEEISSPTIIYKGFEGPFNPIEDPYDQIFSFIVCQKLDFKLDSITSEINELYNDDIEYRNRHNLVLSIEDGLLLYKIEKGYHYPTHHEKIHKNRFVKADNNDTHIKTFVHYLFMGTTSATILYPELVDYIGEELCSENFVDEE